LSNVRLVIFPLAISSELCFKDLHNKIDVIKFNLFFLFVEEPRDEFINFSSGSSQFRIEMILYVVITSIGHLLGDSAPFVPYFAVELK